MKIDFKNDIEYLQEIYEDEYKTKISLVEFWDIIIMTVEDLIREKEFIL